MATAKKAKATKKPGSGPVLPAGTEAMLRLSQVALACGISAKRLCEWIGKGEYPKPDGYHQGIRFWKQSTHNAFIDKLTKKDAKHAGGVQEAD